MAGRSLCSGSVPLGAPTGRCPSEPPGRFRLRRSYVPRHTPPLAGVCGLVPVPRRALAAAGWHQGGDSPASAPFLSYCEQDVGGILPTVRSHAAMCARSATDLLTSRPFVPLPRGTFHHRSHKLLGSSVPSWRRASAHARHDSARATGGRRAVRFNGLLAELGACPHAGTPRPRPARAGTDIARCPSVPRGVRASRSENREFIRRVF